MSKVIFRAAAVAMLASIPASAHALSFTVNQFGSGALAASQANYTSLLNANIATVFATETFEGFAVGQIATAALPTSVGSFTTVGGDGGGDTVVGDGTNVAVRQNNVGITGGRQNTSFASATDKTYLDSNDTKGFIWNAGVAGGLMFDRLLFTLTDPADQGKILTISANNHSQTFTIAPTQPNGEIFNVLIGFSSAVSAATITLAKNGINDGFSIDNVTVGAVPLPAAAWLLLGVAGALVAAKRRSERRAA